VKQIGLKYVEKYGFKNLKESLKNKKYCILRTITHDVPHYIVVDYYDELQNIFYVLDPWLGEIKYFQSELDKIWKERDYYYFEI